MYNLKKLGHSGGAGAANTYNGIMVPKWEKEVQSHHPNWRNTTYCWSHGAGVHPGEYCKNKRLGHKAESKATTILVGNTFGLTQGLWWLGYPTSNLNLTNDELNLEHLANFSKTKTKCSGKPPTNLEQYGIADTGSTQKYIRLNTPCSNNKKISNSPQVILPDGSIMQATHRALLNLNPLLNQSVCTSHIFPHLQSGALIAIGRLCSDV